MRLLKPAWVCHDGKPIFSIDIHPDGSRFATGGQGNNSGKVAIWAMSPVRDENIENDENAPKLICQMDNHLACVNCVRWSIDGRYLASAGDDKLVMIWQFSRTGGMSSTFGSASKLVNIETWRAVHILRGHSGDVLDIAWSPDNSFLASCSIDNTIIVWNALKFPEQTAVLHGHSGLVKGVTWDPIGKYLASQSDDRTVRIWRTYDWKTETVVSEPFKECGGTTHVLRLSWSPDGQYVVSAHAMNNSGPTAQIIERGNNNGWVTKMDFVGHRKAVTVVRFNSRMFTKKFKKNPDKCVPYTCCAVGSRDRSVSVWVTALRRPLVILHDLFNNSVLDISWSSNGTELMCCSWDGTVAYFEFSLDEIGQPMSADEKVAIHRQLYGENVLQPKNSVANRIVESAEVLQLQKQNDKQQKAAAAAAALAQQQKQQQAAAAAAAAVSSRPPVPAAALDSNSSMSASLNKQIETRTKDGRRRITPIFLAPQPDVGDMPLPFLGGGPPVFSSSKETSCIVVEKKDEITSPLGASNSSRMKDSSRSMHDAADAGVVRAAEAASGNSRPAFTASLTPAAASLLAVTGLIQTAGDGAKVSAAVDATVHTTAAAVVSEKVGTETTDKSDRLTIDLTTSTHTHHAHKSKNIYLHGEPKKKDGRGRPRKDRMLEPMRPAGLPVTPTVLQPLPSAANATPNLMAVDREPAGGTFCDLGLQLPVPTIDRRLTFPITRAGTGTDSQLLIQVDNNIRVTSAVTMCRLHCTDSSGKVLWEVLVTCKLNIVVGNSVVVCAASEDHCIHVFNTLTGRRLCPPLVVTSAVSELRCAASFVMAVTSIADVSVWNVRSMTCTVKNVSLDYLLSGVDVTLDSCRLTEQGLPVVSLSNGRTFTFHADLNSWLLLTSRDDVLYQCSDHQTTVTSGARSTGLLAELQATTRRRASIQGSNLFHSDTSLQRVSSVCHLENQLACSIALRSAKEYHFWLLAYVRYLIQEAMESKLRDVCEDLLGPTHSRVQSAASRWDPVILGYRKHSLLREILPIIGANLGLQRLFTEYQQQLVAIDNTRS